MSFAADRLATPGSPGSGLHDSARSAPAAGRSVLDELMTAREVAETLQMKVSTIEDYARRRVLPSVKVGRHRRFVRSHLEEALGALTERRA
jgi:excisionase family DNA binding protein